MTITLRQSACLPLVLSCAVAALSACGNAANADIVGTSAVTVDADGSPVAVVRVCHGQIDTIEVHGDREGLADDEPNPTIGTWRAESGQDGMVEVSLATASEGWTGSGPLEMVDGRTYILLASDSEKDAEASQVSFTGAQIAALDPDQVITGDGTVEPRSGFGDCES